MNEVAMRKMDELVDEFCHQYRNLVKERDANEVLHDAIAERCASVVETLPMNAPGQCVLTVSLPSELVERLIARAAYWQRPVDAVICAMLREELDTFDRGDSNDDTVMPGPYRSAQNAAE